MTYASAIEACSRMISGRAANSGAARRISAPLLNIVLGAGAEECLETIRQSYQDCWSAAADQLCWLKTEDCLDEAGFENRVGDAFYTMRSNPGAFGSNSTLRMAYFGDVMDDRFPELFQAVQHQPDFGQAVTVAEYYFQFVRQVFNSDRERIGRLRAVVDWAERNGKHLIVQSDLTNGNVSGSGPEGYQAAANVMVIVNSQDDNRLGQGLEAAIWGAGSSAVWSLSADRKVKETDEIACAAMEQILTECLEQAGAAGGQSNIQETLCGAQQDYDSLFREYIDEKELLPDLPTFLQYLPYTKEMEALEQSLSDAPTRGLLGRLRGRPSDTIDGDKLINAVASVGDIWGLCVNQYYGRCVQELKENAERVQEYFKQLLCSRLSYGAMNATLQQEAVNLETRTDWHAPMNMRRGTLAERLHRYACSQVLPEVYGFLAGQLCAAMKDVCRNARDFGNTLTETRNGLRQSQGNVDETIRRAYTQEIANLANQPEYRDMMRLTPCSTVESLLDQLVKRFRLIADKDDNFRLSLFDELQFRAGMAGGGAAYGVAVQSLFDLNMQTAGRLMATVPPSGGQLFCMLSQPTQIQNVNNTGAAFRIPQQDYVDRLYVYPVNPKKFFTTKLPQQRRRSEPMPITRPNVNLYSINNLALDYDPGSGRYGLSLECPRADAFTLCLGKNLPLADPEKLGLTEEELRRLHNGQSMEKRGYRLIGVTQGTFYAMPVFRGFEADPPQTIQVWSMMAVPGGIVHLYYTPGREAVCFIPLRYSAALQRNGLQTVLQVTLSDQFIGSYTDGALMYRVGESDPIPLPGGWLNREIPLRVSDGEEVRVLPAPGFENSFFREGV